MNNKLEQAINQLINNINESYFNWTNDGYNDPTIKLDIKIKSGKKFIKIIEGTRVWGFVSKTDGTHKGLPMKEGDVFKPASWSAAAKHTRGNVFADDQNYFTWTGPKYL